MPDRNIVVRLTLSANPEVRFNVSTTPIEVLENFIEIYSEELFRDTLERLQSTSITSSVVSYSISIEEIE